MPTYHTASEVSPGVNVGANRLREELHELAARAFGRVRFQPMIERPVLVLEVAPQKLHELVDRRLVERVEIGAYAQVGQEAPDLIVVPSGCLDCVVVERLDEWKDLPFFELEMRDESPLDIRKRLHERGAIGAFRGTRKLEERLLEQGVLCH